ncbi:CdaR family protein [Pedosphaera parvula]|uniref:YbbR family protein n=1 Tax=Pedosphaera parvula (strain Ellin514) TaxID=320771 RepID=B9XBN1_PEDPL|nr:CdaR family protein [Pedosphaera parvula]EEF62916.1 YbbR family protein [Pedosphaera parvula Ellin514]
MAARDYILHNFWWKLLSVLLAALTWFTIQTAFQKDQTLRQSPVITTSTRSFASIPIILQTSAANTNRYRISPVTVTVEVSGTADVLEKLQTKQIQAVVDVSEAAEEKEFRKDIQVQVPKDLKVVSTKPIYVSVERITGQK